MEIEACALSQYNRGHLWYSAAIAQLKMEYLQKAFEDDIVDSPPRCAIILVTINAPSPLQDKGMGESSKPRCRDSNGAQRSLNLGLSQSPNNKLHKIGLLNGLPSTAFSIVSL